MGERRSASRMPPFREGSSAMPRFTTVRRQSTCGPVLRKPSGQGADEFAVGVAPDNLEADHAAFDQAAVVVGDALSG